MFWQIDESRNLLEIKTKLLKICCEISVKTAYEEIQRKITIK